MTKRNQKVIAPAGRSVIKGVAAYVLMISCGVMLLSGFFFAARQHFASMDVSMKNSRLRRQIDQLESEKRRLINAREVSLSPIQIKKTAKKLGLLDRPEFDSRFARSADPIEIRASTASSVSSEKILVQKTSAVQPTTKSASVDTQRNLRSGRNLPAR